MANSCPPRAYRWPAIASLAVFALLLTGTASGAPPVPAFSSQYRFKASSFPLSVSATRTLKPLQDGTWQMEVLASNFLGEIRETSVFSWQDCTPVTHYYGYKRRGFGQLKTAEVKISAEGDTASSERSKREPSSFPIQPGATDKISMTLALQCELARGQRQVSLSVVDERRQETQHFEIEGKETLVIGGRKLDTVKVRRVRDTHDDRQTWLWFAPERDYTLVQLVQENDDGRHTLTLETLP